MNLSVTRVLCRPFLPANATFSAIPVFALRSQPTTAFVRFFRPSSSPRGSGNNSNRPPARSSAHTQKPFSRPPSQNSKPFARPPSSSPSSSPSSRNAGDAPKQPTKAGGLPEKDEQIKSKIIQLVDQNGTFHGNRNTSFVLSKMNREKYFLVVVSQGGGKGKDGEEVYPTARLVQKSEYKEKQKAQEQSDKIRKQATMKIKEYRFSASISDGDIEHKFKAMRDTLQKGDGLRLAFTNKGAKNVTPGRKKELFALISKRLDDVAVLQNEDNADGGEVNKQNIYALYHPKVSKVSIVMQRVKEKKEEKQK